MGTTATSVVEALTCLPLLELLVQVRQGSPTDWFLVERQYIPLCYLKITKSVKQTTLL